jgi:hypothetical protein
MFGWSASTDKRDDVTSRAYSQSATGSHAGVDAQGAIGIELRRISDPRFHSPWVLAFLGNTLLGTNGDLEPGRQPEAWKIFRLNVGEPGLPLNRPRVRVN